MAEASWADYRLFPYEKVLAAREVAALVGGSPITTRTGVEITTDNAQVIIERSTYFSAVETAGSSANTQQAAVERRHAAVRGIEHRRQATRYGLHGIHEYKGKFNPQVVRALTNVADPGSDLLIDPFCGSGTSLVEAVRLGMDAFGIDRSPMAVLISQAKAMALAEDDVAKLRRSFVNFVRAVAGDMKEAQQTGELPFLDCSLPVESENYVRGWFPQEVLAAVAVALRATFGDPHTTVHALAQVALSSILRTVSLQMPEDLRIRRRTEPFDPPPVWELFLDACDKVEAGLEEIEGWPPISAMAEVRLGSASDRALLANRGHHRRRFILTSPPYATALPYIDTDRLSIIALGLGSVREVRQLDMNLVGSREWRKAEERGWWGRVARNTDSLPSAVTALVHDIRARNQDGGAGFRRAAVPALLYRYFARMAECFDAWHQVLWPGERAVLIVGNNRTTAGGDQIVIRTPELLGQVAETRGYSVDEIIRLETWPRYGIHGKNGVSGEDAVVVRRR